MQPKSLLSGLSGGLSGKRLGMLPMNKDLTWTSVGTPIGKRNYTRGEFSIRKGAWNSVESSIVGSAERLVQDSIWKVVDDSIELVAGSVQSTIKELVQ